MDQIPPKEGRPTDYRPEFCELLIQHMSEGFKYESFAAVIDVSRSVLYNWEKVHPEFMDAKNRGKDKSLLWWEKEGKKGLWDKTFNSTVYVWSTKNIHNWKDKQDIAVTSKSQNLSAKSINEKIEAAKEAIKFLEAQKRLELGEVIDVKQSEIDDMDMGVPI